MMRDRTPLRVRARDRWTSILPSLGISERYLTGKHGPCPICREGKDRFRFDNKDGLGTWICSVCGAGDGVKLVMEVLGLDFKDAARAIEGHLGDAPVEASRSSVQDDAQKREAMNQAWREAKAVEADDPVGLWLARRVGLTTFPTCLRTAPSLLYKDASTYRKYPAMLAMVTGNDGTPAALHRTYLTAAGDKAPVDCTRKLWGLLPKGGAVRLAEHGSVLGIAEGIETAFAATSLFGVPCWSAINKVILEKWEPPATVEHVIIFGDNDPKFGGQKYAYALAYRLATRSDRSVEVRLPPEPGADWNDIYLAEAPKRRPVEQQHERIAA